jgi:hypothetical protein
MLPMLMLALQGGATALNMGASLYNSNMNAKAIMRQAESEAEQILENGRQVVQAQRSISSGAGFINTNETSTYQLMLDTETEAKRQAERIRYLARKEAKAMKKGGLLNAFGSLLSGASSIGSNFK